MVWGACWSQARCDWLPGLHFSLSLSVHHVQIYSSNFKLRKWRRKQKQIRSDGNKCLFCIWYLLDLLTSHWQGSSVTRWCMLINVNTRTFLYIDSFVVKKFTGAVSLWPDMSSISMLSFNASSSPWRFLPLLKFNQLIYPLYCIRSQST